jgi:dCTP deaminase
MADRSVDSINSAVSYNDQLGSLLVNMVKQEIAPTGMSFLSDKAIVREREAGNILIDPFNMDNLGTGSYDVTLGMFYYRENREANGLSFYNPYSKSDVARVWGGQDDYEEAIKVSEWRKQNRNFPLENITDDDYIIVLDPGETILAHTNEFIGGTDNTIDTMMKARSSTGRNFIEVCKCAGLGDIGYCNRWTMEITNNSSKYQIPLVVGRRVAQILFFKTEGTLKGVYSDSGKYQETSNIQKMMKDWHPSMMLPRMYNDREVKAMLAAIKEKEEREVAPAKKGGKNA